MPVTITRGIMRAITYDPTPYIIIKSYINIK